MNQLMKHNNYGYFPPEESFPHKIVKVVGVLWADS